jgi:hypothetical protein
MVNSPGLKPTIVNTVAKAKNLKKRMDFSGFWWENIYFITFQLEPVKTYE